jgi:hypothetical protein
MQKKALLVGVGNYLGYAAALRAPTTDIGKWAELLGGPKYQFADIATLIDGQATRDAVLEAFRNLVKDAKAGDLLVFLWEGHGSIVKAHEKGPFLTEEALIVSPRKGDSQLSGAEVTDSDITKIINEESPAAGTLIDFILVTCFAAAFDPSESNGTQIGLRSEYAMLDDFDLMKTREFGSLGVVSEDFDLDGGGGRAGRKHVRSKNFEKAKFAEAASTRPIIVASTGREETATEDPATGRMLFSESAIDYLSQPQRNPTFDQFINDLQQLLSASGQTPQLRGNTARKWEIFPGQVLTNAAPHPDDDSLVSPLNLSGANMYTFDVRFEGICCFADSSVDESPYKKRVLLPYDERTDDTKHIAFLEIAEDLIDQWSGEDPIDPYPHEGGGVEYRRWNLQGHRITFDNAIGTGLQTTQSFIDHVPGMRVRIFPQLDYYAREECFRPFPPSSLVAGFVEITAGTLSAGPLENVATKYVRKSGAVTTTVRTAKFAELRLYIGDPRPIIKLNNKSVETTIYLKPGASPLIGNMREIDIIEPKHPKDDPPESFGLFYKLSRFIVTDPPLPAPVAVPIDGCSSTGWP